MEFSSVADNLRESFRVIAASRKAGQVCELPGVSIASAGATFQMFNSAFFSAPVSDETELKQRIRATVAHFDGRAEEWAYWVCLDWIDQPARKRSRRWFEHYGLRFAMELPGMAADHILPPVRPLPEIEVRRVGSQQTWDAFCDIGSCCFHVPINWFREVFDSAAVWDRFISFVGYVDGQPAATTSLVEGAGVLGVYNVATLPDFRRRGYGEAVMRRAIEEYAHHNPLEQIILQSTPAGLNLYQRMGFRTIASVAVYSS